MSGKLEPEDVPCSHDLILLNRTTFHVSCADCKELLAEPPAAKPPVAAVTVAATKDSCPHLMVTTDSATNMTSCLVCKQTLTKETYVDWRGDVRGTVDDEANMTALPKYLFDPTFKGAHTGGVASYSYEEAYKGDANSNWDPTSGKACPHYLKTTNVKTGKVTCSMCNHDVI